jgi:AcrR family transcriptional regulator
MCSRSDSAEISLSLSTDEVEFIRQFFAGYRHAELEHYLRHWVELITEIEEGGYKLNLDDYSNDIFVRETIEDVIECAPETLRQKLIESLRPWDERFRAATFVTEKFKSPFEGEWWYRLPKKAKGELADDFRKMGIP